MSRSGTTTETGRERGTRRAMTAALAAAAALACAVPTAAQEDPRVQVSLEALEHVRASLPAGRVVLDPWVLCSATIAGWSCPDPMPERIRAMNMEIGSREFSYVCTKRSSDCRLVGADVLVQLGEPRITGNTASVVVNVWWSTGDDARPVGSRRSQLHLRRDGSGWEVVRERMGSGRGGSAS